MWRLAVGILRIEGGGLHSADVIFKIIAGLFLLKARTNHVEASAHAFGKLVVAHLDDVVHIFYFNIQQPDKSDRHQNSE